MNNTKGGEDVVAYSHALLSNHLRREMSQVEWVTEWGIEIH